MADVVLVHGAWHGAWCWRRALEPLAAGGHRVHAVTLTGVGERRHLMSSLITLETHIADVVNAIEAEEMQDVVLAVHSYAGMLGTAVADRMPRRLRHLVYVDAVVPQPGESWSSTHASATREARLAAAQASPDFSFPPPDPSVFGLAGDLNPEQRRYLTYILHSSEHLLGVITDLLDLAKLQAGKVRLAPERFGIGEVLADIEAMMAPIMLKKGQTLRLELPASLPPVWADGTKTLQVLLNLVSNAHKYTPAAGHVVVAAREAGAMVEVAVVDDGVGIAPEDLPHLFEEFTRVAKRGRPGPKGTGLGLAISKGLVEAMGGQMKVESAPGTGSRFAFTLPLATGTP